MTAFDRLVQAQPALFPPERPIVLAAYQPRTGGKNRQSIFVVAMGPPATYWGLPALAWAGQEDTVGRWEVVQHELRAFVALLSTRNADILGMLALPPTRYMILSEVGRRLIAARDLFLPPGDLDLVTVNALVVDIVRDYLRT